MIKLTLKKENVITHILFPTEYGDWASYKIKGFIREFPDYEYEFDFRDIYDDFYADDLPKDMTARAIELRELVGF
jgi:hypothetical protein